MGRLTRVLRSLQRIGYFGLRKFCIRSFCLPIGSQRDTATGLIEILREEQVALLFFFPHVQVPWILVPASFPVWLSSTCQGQSSGAKKVSHCQQQLLAAPPRPPTLPDPQGEHLAQTVQQAREALFRSRLSLTPGPLSRAESSEEQRYRPLLVLPARARISQGSGPRWSLARPPPPVGWPNQAGTAELRRPEKRRGGTPRSTFLWLSPSAQGIQRRPGQAETFQSPRGKGGERRLTSNPKFPEHLWDLHCSQKRHPSPTQDGRSPSIAKHVSSAPSGWHYSRPSSKKAEDGGPRWLAQWLDVSVEGSSPACGSAQGRTLWSAQKDGADLETSAVRSSSAEEFHCEVASDPLPR
ncbi:uncharacterized protein PHA67_006671 [Liasis olivaceus]